MSTREPLVVRLTPIPVVEPFAQKASSNGTQVHCSAGAWIGVPGGRPPPVPPVPVVEDEAADADDDEPPPSPPVPDPVGVVPELEQAARPRRARSERRAARMSDVHTMLRVRRNGP